MHHRITSNGLDCDALTACNFTQQVKKPAVRKHMKGAAVDVHCCTLRKKLLAIVAQSCSPDARTYKNLGLCTLPPALNFLLCNACVNNHSSPVYAPAAQL
jgi:hypothetical protein